MWSKIGAVGNAPALYMALIGARSASPTCPAAKPSSHLVV